MPETKTTYTRYFCHCGVQWQEDWDCACNDECPVCKHEIEPYSVAEDGGEASLCVDEFWTPEGGLPEGIESVTELEGWNDEWIGTVTIELKVWDRAEFRKAAYKRALEDGQDEAEAKTFLTEATTIGDCAIMLLDPGPGPAGSDIVESSSD